MSRSQYSYFLKLYLFLILLAGFGCRPDRPVPDVSHMELDVDIRRFEQDLMQVDTNRLSEGVERLQTAYGNFFSDVFLYIMKDTYKENETPEAIVGKALRSPLFRQLADTVQMIYPDLSETESELNQALKYYHYYFPDRPVPEVVSFISEYALGVFTYGDSLLGVGLDFFLGPEYPYYDPMVFPEYIQRTMDRPYIVPKMMEALASQVVGEVKGNRLLDHMVHNGKILYLKDQFLPFAPDSVKMEYTQAQMKWVEDNELPVWAYFLKEELLYETRMQEIQKLINPSPVAPGGMPREAPGRIANWVGWQIVKAFMDRHPDATVEDLIGFSDVQKFLEASRYKPDR